MDINISVIIASYNAEDTISRAVESVLTQTYKDYEIIIVDDGSTDNTANILKKYVKNSNQVKYIWQVNSGVSAARNKGLSEAKGKFIQFLDADDSLQPEMLSSMVRSQLEQKSDLVICGLRVIRNEKVLREPRLKETFYRNINFEVIKAIYPLLAAPCNKLYKKENIKKFDTTVNNGEDLLFNLEYIQTIQSISVIEKSLYNVFLDNEYSQNKRTSIQVLDNLLHVNTKEIEILGAMFGFNSTENFCFYNRLRIIQSLLSRIVVVESRERILDALNRIKNDSSFLHYLKYNKPDTISLRITSSMFVYFPVSLIYIVFKLISIIRGR